MKRKPESTTPALPKLFGQQLGKVSLRYSGLITRLLEPHELTYPQFTLLLHLAQASGPRRVSDMARAVELTQSAVTKAVQKFATLGLVEISRDGADGRNKPVQITPQGRAHLAAVQRSFGPAFARLLQGWEMQELERLTADLSRLLESLDMMRGDP